jgi:hypothetical protein
MKTLLLNTVTEHPSLSLFDGNRLMVKKAWKSQRDEAERILNEIQKLLSKTRLKPQQIDRIAVCIGPAGFTSARIGVSIANAWSFAMHIPLAKFSIFDCFTDDETVVIPCNTSEAWVRNPGKPPLLSLQTGQSVIPSKPCPLPFPSTLHFDHKLAHPWYYKDAKITWSKRIHSSIPCSTSSQPPSETLKTSPSVR